MSDREDGARSDGPSDVPANDDATARPAERPTDADAAGPEDGPSGVGGWLQWFWTTDSGAAVYARDVITSVAAVLVVGMVLFAISGIWPPMVAVESGSMNPNMEKGDLVFVVDDERFVPDEAATHEGTSTGVIPADRAAEVGHTEFGRNGDVIVFMPNGKERRTPVIHRAMLFVEAGENWYDRADGDAIGSADDCEALTNCPAPHAGFITKGDNRVTNQRYDQVSGLSDPVRPEWVVGTAKVKVPYLGHVRLAFSGQTAVQAGPATASISPSGPTAATAPAAGAGSAHPAA